MAAPAAVPALVGGDAARRVVVGARGGSAVTFTVTVHEPPAGTVPPESATLAPLFAAVTVPAPHVVAPLALAVLTRPAG